MRILKLLIMTACLGLSGCMQHNGRIGDWFGTWKLTEIEVNGSKDTEYDDNIFFQFQTDVVRIVEVDVSTSNSFKDCFGSWSDREATLVLDFGYTADNMDAGFTPPAITRLGREENILRVSKESSRAMTWTLQKPDSDQTVTYRLKKQ